VRREGYRKSSILYGINSYDEKNLENFFELGNVGGIWCKVIWEE